MAMLISENINLERIRRRSLSVLLSICGESSLQSPLILLVKKYRIIYRKPIRLPKLKLRRELMYNNYMSNRGP